MSAQSSNENACATSNASDVVPRSIISADTSYSNRNIAQNYLLIWFDTDLDKTNEHCQNTLEHLRNEVNNINIFTNQVECVDFLTKLEDTKTFLIVGDTIGRQTIPLIHNVPQLDQVYVFRSNTSLQNEWIKEWPKVKSVHTDIASLCAALKTAIKQCNQNSIALSFVPSNENDSNQNLDELEPSFMYTQIIKEILLTMKHDDISIHDFIIFCRSSNSTSSEDIELFKKEYKNEFAINWYSRLPFIYSMLNRALRTFQADIIIKMGFFIFDLHSQIEQLYREQRSSYEGKSFQVYRGQGLSKTDFKKLVNTKGGLISFNNFLSTSQDQQVSLSYAESNLEAMDTVGILFVISVDPAISSTPFAFIKSFSNFEEEDEILFSMHTVFRIDDIKQINDHKRLYEVKLRLTADDDEELRILTKCISEEIKGDIGWKRLGNLLLKIGQVDQAEELYNALLEQTSNDRDKVHYYSQLIHVKCNQGDYITQFSYCLKMIELEKKINPSNHPDLNVSNNNIGLVYCNRDEYTRILVFYDKTFTTNEKTFPSNDLPLTTSSDHPSFYKKALEVFEKNLSSNYSDLAISCNNTDKVYNSIEEPSEILWFNRQLLEMRQKRLSLNHPDLAISYYNIATIYQNMDEHLKALSFHKEALRIVKENLPRNHPHLASTYHNIGMVYNNIGKYSKALFFYEKALKICQRSLPLKHPQLINSYTSIADILKTMKQYSKAILFYKKALGFEETILPLNHDHFTASYNNVTEENENIEQNLKALEIRDATLLPDYPHSFICYDNIARIYENTEEHPKALLFYQKALESCQKNLPPNHSRVAALYNNIGRVYCKMEDFKSIFILRTSFEHFENLRI